MVNNAYNYSHIEELIIHHNAPTPTTTEINQNKKQSKKIKKSIYYHTLTSLQVPSSSTSSNIISSSTPFPIQIIDLLIIKYPFINRILIQIGSSSLKSSSSSSSAKYNDIRWNDYLLYKNNNDINLNDDDDDDDDDNTMFPSQVYKSINGLSVYINYNTTLLSETTNNNNNHNIWNEIIRSLLGKKLLCASILTSNDKIEQKSDSSYTYNDDNKSNYWKIIPSAEPITPECINHINYLFLPCNKNKHGLYSNVFDTLVWNDDSRNPSIVWIDITKSNLYSDGSATLNLDIGTVYDRYIKQQSMSMNNDGAYGLNGIFSFNETTTANKKNKNNKVITTCPLAYDTIIHTILPKTSLSSNDNNDMNITSYHYTPGTPIDLSYTIPQQSSTPNQRDNNNAIRISRSIQNSISNTITTIVENSFSYAINNISLYELYPTNLFIPSYSTMNIRFYDLITRYKIVNHEWNDNIIYDVQSSKDSKAMIILRISNVTIPSKTILYYTIQYQPIFLPIEHTPLPPNYGIPLPPSILSFNNYNHATTTTANTLLYSPNVLYTPPITDSSMVFNVISFTCTFYAFVIGMIYNTLLKKSSECMKRKIKKNDHKEEKKKNKIYLLLQRVMFWKKDGKKIVDVDHEVEVDLNDNVDKKDK